MDAYDLVVIGGGPAGLAAAISAWDAGIRRILILERAGELGGILNQCIHSGFGLETFGQELTGPEFAARYIQAIRQRNVECWLNTTAVAISPEKIVTAMGLETGLRQIRAGAVILAMGCRERPRGALDIPGTRPEGIFTAGMAQRMVNVEGILPGKKVVILGSGDIGLIMARRMTLEGAQVRMVVERLPHAGGLQRNVVQCLEDFDIPLRLCHTVTEIHGQPHLTGVTVARVDERGCIIAGTEETVDCDTLLLSCGLIPDIELCRDMGLEENPQTGGPQVNTRLETGVPGIFAAGNVHRVHDLADSVVREAEEAGRSAAGYLRDSREVPE